jgi:hypothetical protein
VTPFCISSAARTAVAYSSRNKEIVLLCALPKHRLLQLSPNLKSFFLGLLLVLHLFLSTKQLYSHCPFTAHTSRFSPPHSLLLNRALAACSKQSANFLPLRTLGVPLLLSRLSAASFLSFVSVLKQLSRPSLDSLLLSKITMALQDDTWDLDQWELDQCRYCKGPIDDPTESYCSTSCELKWNQQRFEHDNSPTSSSVFSSHAIPSIQSTPRSSPASSALSTPEFGPILLPAGSVPNLPLDPSISTFPHSSSKVERRHSYAVRTHRYGTSLNPIKKSFPSNYYQSTIGDRSSAQPVFIDKSVSLGIRKTSIDDIRPRSDGSDKHSVTAAADRNAAESSTPTANSRSRWSWRRFSTLV